MHDICQTISHYKIVDKIGGGGMGVVYKAEDTKLKRHVALKFLHEASAHNRQKMDRFKREARAASALNHPSIVTIHDIEEVDGNYFIAMEYIEGKTLHELITGGELYLDQVLDYGIQISDALSKAHLAGIIHRDIKPSNLMITDGNLAKVLDFGLAKLADQPADLSLVVEDESTQSITESTREGKILGTLSYMSPEQARGDEVDHRTDIFSLGIVLYQMITGELPFRGPHAAATLDKLLHSPAPSLRTTHSNLPVALDRTISRALAKNPEDRYQSMQEMASDLRAVRSGTEHIRPAPRKRKKHTVVFVVAAILLVLLLALPFRQWLATRIGRSALPAEINLAMLPFVNVGDDPENQLICDGLIERLATKFNQIQQFETSLSLIALSEVRSERITSAAQARSAFGANMAITGSLQRLRDSVFLTVNLVDTMTQRQIDSAACSAAAGDTLTLGNNAFEKAVLMLDLNLSPKEMQRLSAGETMNLKAHNAYLRGIVLLARFDKTGNVDKAIQFFQQAVREDSMYALAHAGLGEAYWRKFQDTHEPQWADAALSSCAHAAALDSRIPRVHLTEGMVYRGTGQPEKAVGVLNQAIQMEPRNDEAYRVLGRAYEEMDRIDDAEAVYSKAIQLQPDSWQNYWDFGAFFVRRARYVQAAEHFNKVIQLAPDNYKAYASLGGIYLYMGEFERAEQIFAKSLDISPSSQAYSNLAACYMLQERYPEAVPLLAKAIDIEAANYELWGNLGDAYSQIPGLSEKAPEAFARAIALVSSDLEVNPQKIVLRAKRASYLVRLGNIEKALEEIVQVEKLASKDPEVLFWTATVYEVAGNRAKALEALAGAIAAGYSQPIIEAASELVQLRKDPRYPELFEKQSPR